MSVGPSVSDQGGEADLELPGVTFEVREWYVDGTGDTVTVDMPWTARDADVGLLTRGDAFGTGSRLLISGEPRWGGAPLDAPIAWSCGFSRYYDEKTASTWQETFGR